MLRVEASGRNAQRALYAKVVLRIHRFLDGTDQRGAVTGLAYRVTKVFGVPAYRTCL